MWVTLVVVLETLGAGGCGVGEAGEGVNGGGRWRAVAMVAAQNNATEHVITANYVNRLIPFFVHIFI